MKVHIQAIEDTREVWLNGKQLKVKPSQKWRNHSTAFAWGYGGSGPSQLSLAICLELWGPGEALKYYHDFKWKFVQNWKGDLDLELDLTQFMKTREIPLPGEKHSLIQKLNKDGKKQEFGRWEI